MNKKLFILALGAAMVAVSCEKKNPEVIDPEVDLIGDITEDRTPRTGSSKPETPTPSPEACT